MRRKKFIFLILIYLLPFQIALADIAIFNHGSKLKVKSYIQEGDYFRLILSENGEMRIPASWIKEIIIQSKDNMEEEMQQNSLNEPPYLSIIKKYSQEASLDWQLIYAIVKIESNFNPKAVSPKGAQGLMQLMPATALLYNLTDPFNPVENLKAGIKHFKMLLSLYNNDLALTLAAYNAGIDNVKFFNGIPPFPETQQYVKKILGYYNSLKKN